ncbi:MAG: ABC-2 type transport system permease protein [Candidatus Saccharimonadales bacterium]|jgi:ABC-2 type transport system permease protein
MRDLKIVFTLTRAFTVRYFRDKVALFFTFLFPVVFLFVFGSIFSNDSGPEFNISLINKSESQFANAFAAKLDETEIFVIDEDSPDFAVSEEKMGRGELDGIIELPESFGVIGDEGNPSGELKLFYDEGDQQLAITLQAVLGSIIDAINQDINPVKAPFSLNAQSIQTADLSQFDYTLAGLIGFSILSLGIFSMSEGFTGDKKLGALRRMQVSPIKVWQLVVATAINRILVGIISVAIMFVIGVVVFDFNMRGDYFSFISFTVLAITCMFGFGMAIAGWAKDANQAAPLSNLISFPMMFLSGVFFPTFLMPDLLQKVVVYVPLTPIVDGLRLILTEGKTIFDLGPQLGVMLVWTVVIYLLAFKLFRWE